MVWYVDDDDDGLTAEKDADGRSSRMCDEGLMMASMEEVMKRLKDCALIDDEEEEEDDDEEVDEEDEEEEEEEVEVNVGKSEQNSRNVVVLGQQQQRALEVRMLVSVIECVFLNAKFSVRGV